MSCGSWSTRDGVVRGMHAGHQRHVREELKPRRRDLDAEPLLFFFAINSSKLSSLFTHISRPIEEAKASLRRGTTRGSVICFRRGARFPFLDEDVIKTLLEIPLWEITDLDQPIERGDKQILREVARLLGLVLAATMPKRAIQFGSRIARESDRKNFGSNRAANMTSAGSVIARPM